MTAYAPTWTGRIKLSYFAAQAVHSQTWRYPGPSSGSGVTDCLTAIHDYYTALQAQMFDDLVVNAVTVADLGSPVFLPIVNPFTDLAGAIATATFKPEDKARVLTFIGRTTAGGPWKVSQFGVSPTDLEGVATENYRVLYPENATIAAAIDALTAAAGIIIGNDAQPVAIYEYADWKPNDRWVKKTRRGA
jgi:hypothetical protein